RGIPDLLGQPADEPDEVPLEDALGAHHVAAVREDAGEAVVAIGEAVEGKVRPRHRAVGTGNELKGVVASRVHLVLAAAIRSRVEVAARAGLDAVAADLHVPEQSLAEGDGGLPVLD